MEAKTLHITQNDWTLNPISKGNNGSQFSADDLIDAYFNGRKDQVDNDNKLRLETLNKNLERAAKLSLEILAFIRSSGFSCEMVYMKVKNIYQFTALFLVNEDDFCKDEFLSVYKKSVEIKKANNTESTFDFTSIITPANPHFDPNAVLIDGYNLSYGGKLHVA
ncbi:MAG: hypothetical protein MH137_06345 [Flavobacteriales bacterium]|nr:hypothetical protein [Flavobacteriales bacterium]